MKRLYVRPSCQGQGLGRQLAESLISHARRIGYSRMLLDTLPTMSGALGLYASLGFVRCPAYYDCPVDGNVFLSLDLAAKPEKGSSARAALP